MLDRIKVGGVRGVTFAWNCIALKKRKHNLRSVDFCIVLLKERTTEGRAYVLKDRNKPAAQ